MTLKTATAKMATALVLLTSALTAAPAGANHTYVPPVDRSSVPELAGRTTIFGDRSGWTRVRLPAGVDSRKLYGFDTEVHGDGRVIALFMMREIDGHVRRNAPDMWLMRFGNCGTRACEPSPWSGPWMSSSAGRLPAGIYRIYLVVDGAPASVSLDIPGLSGATRINPTGKVQAKVSTLTPRIEESTTGLVFSAGDKAPFGGRGIALQGQFIDPVGAGVIDNGYCVYEDEAPSEPALAYMRPACDESPSPTPYRLRTITPINDTCCWGFQLAMNYLPKAMGSWYTSTAPVESSGAVALWLSLK